MPADRFLHPKAGRSEKVSALSDFEYRVWTQYMLSADDFGVMRATAFPLQNGNDYLAKKPTKLVERALTAIIGIGLLATFKHQGCTYVYQWDWQTWQKIDYPRATLEPALTSDALATCDAATQALMVKHPGGTRVKRPKDAPNNSAHIQDAHPEDMSSNAGAQPRETAKANGYGSDLQKEKNVYPRFDVWLFELIAAYPPEGRNRSGMTDALLMDALNAFPGGPEAGWVQMRSNLDNQKRGHRWRIKQYIPRLDNWLREGLWMQEHAEHPPETLLSDKTIRTLSSGQQFVEEGHRDAR